VHYRQTDIRVAPRERELNAVAQFTTEIDNARLHFVRLRGVATKVGPAPLPLVLTHGWPSRFLEMLPGIGVLTDPAAHGVDPADAVDVVVP